MQDRNLHSPSALGNDIPPTVKMPSAWQVTLQRGLSSSNYADCFASDAGTASVLQKRLASGFCVHIAVDADSGSSVSSGTCELLETSLTA